MERIAIVENDEIVNVVKAPADWIDPEGREIIAAPHGSGNEIGAQRQPDGSFAKPVVPLTKEEVRSQRDRLLKASDWTQVPDAPVDQQAWATYRQALRDIPQQEGFPESVVWPEKP